MQQLWGSGMADNQSSKPLHACAQGMFVQQLWGSGMVDETEREALLEPVERLERRLLRQGAMGRSTMVYEVRAPALPCAPQRARLLCPVRLTLCLLP